MALLFVAAVFAGAGAATNFPTEPGSISGGTYTGVTLTQGGEYTLQGDVTLETNGLTINGGTSTQPIIIDLNGHTLTGTGSDSVIKISKSKYFTLTDSDTATAHYFTFVDNAAWTPYTGTETSSAVLLADFDRSTAVSGGTVVKIDGGIITGGSATNGGGVNIDQGTFTMSGGSITGCSAVTSGGGVYNLSGTFEMNGDAKITGCSAAWGGGVNNDKGIFNLSGGSITGCSANLGGGGVDLCADTFNLSGAARITGNTKGDTANNVYLEGDYKITLSSSSPLSPGASIGITMQTPPGVFTDGGQGDYTIAAYFTSDDENYIVEISGTELTLTTPVAKIVSTDKKYATVQAAVTAAATSDPYDTIEMLIDTTENITISGKTVTLDLAGHTLTGDGNGSVITVNSGADFTLTDSKKDEERYYNTALGKAWTAATEVDWTASPKQLTPETITSPDDLAAEGAVIKMTGGIITGGSATYGGGVYNCGNFTMESGSITGCSVTGIYGGGGGVYNAGTFEMKGGSIT
ncbi:MAG TPA: hypothetical protein O0X70_03715, partial [Methanocorpusculum sp.]|nr:hypothetical protein [Methanocorpusculum sp.]